jgi:TRAP-type C4-dicarboxylate transport system permease small subunit
MLRRLAQLEFVVSALLLGTIVVLVFAAAIGRTFGYPLIWSVDMAQLLFIWLAFFGATRAMRHKSHLGIDLVVRWLPHRHRLKVELAISAIILAFFALLAVEGYGLAMQNWQRQFGDSGIAYAWVTLAVPVGCIMIGIALIRNMWVAWQQRRTGETLVYSRPVAGLDTPTEL